MTSVLLFVKQEKLFFATLECFDFEVLTAVLLLIQVLRDVTSSELLRSY
jgi:hypothetical protein